MNTSLQQDWAQITSQYLLHDQVMNLLQTWAARYPTLTRLQCIGKSPEGRDLMVLEISRTCGQKRPAMWVDANMHASEFSGTNVSLALACALLEAHTCDRPQDSEFLKGFSPGFIQSLREITVYVHPRVSPDGAEGILKTGRYLRSSPERRRHEKQSPYWKQQDMDQDGQVRYMRIRSETGEMVESKNTPNLMVYRMPGDEGPFYKIYPEGVIENFDGVNVPTPVTYDEFPNDFNRNFPSKWAPEHIQRGAGEYPGSNPETKAVIEFALDHPNIFGWVNLHTFGGVVIRPLGDKPDSKIPQQDFAIFKQLEEWNDEFIGYPTVSAFQEFLYEPEKPMYGDLIDFAFEQRGAITYVIEIWDLMARMGVKRKRPFIDTYGDFRNEEFEKLAAWDKKENNGRIFNSWKKIQHPQLGEVEVGGMDRRIGISNPSLEALPRICQDMVNANLRFFSLAPILKVEAKTETLDSNTSRVRITVRNTGYLGTSGMEHFKSLIHNEPIRVRMVETNGGIRVHSHESSSWKSLGHLAGWGKGVGVVSNLFVPSTSGTIQEASHDYWVSGKGEITIEAGSVRVGFHRLNVTIG